MRPGTSPSPTRRTPKAPPGPRGYPFLLLLVLPKARQAFLQFLLDAACQYGDVVSLRLGFHRAYLVTHPDDIQHVLQDNHRNYRKSTRVERIKPLFGEGLTTSEGALWRRQRRLLQPAFQHQRLAALAPVIIDATAAMLQRWQTVAELGQPLDVAREMLSLTQGIIIRTLFGTDLAGEADGVGQALTVAFEHLHHRVWAVLDLLEHFPTPRNRRFRHALRTLDTFVYRMIHDRHHGGKDRTDLFSMLLNAWDHETGEGMTDAQLRDEVMTLLVAGHTTTATALAWTWFLLSKSPEVERQLQKELRTVLGGRSPTGQDLPALRYTRMVIEEALRLYPPTWVTARTPREDDEIGGYAIPAKSQVLLSPFVTHRHPAFWENPEGFEPERFSPERSAGRPPYAYFPFGGGPRVCVGKGFALTEMQLIIAMVAQIYRLRLVPGHPVEPQPTITLRPRGGILVTLHKHCPEQNGATPRTQ